MRQARETGLFHFSEMSSLEEICIESRLSAHACAVHISSNNTCKLDTNITMRHAQDADWVDAFSIFEEELTTGL